MSSACFWLCGARSNLSHLPIDIRFDWAKTMPL
jgi:hypothetical protein